MPKRIPTLAGAMQPGHTGICGDPNKCAIANQLRATHGAKNPQVGLETIRFTIGETRYTVRTPLALKRFIRDFDKHLDDGAVETVLEATPYEIPLSGKTVTASPVKRMTETDLKRLRAQQAEMRAGTRPDPRPARREKWLKKEKARLS